MQNSTTLYPTPSLKRRLSCLIYDAFLIIAVGALADFIAMFLLQKVGGRILEQVPKMAAFMVVGAYLIHSWSGSGFTLAMKTWRIKLVKVGYARVPFRNAAMRYVFSYGWVVTGGLIYYVVGRHSLKDMSLSMLAGVVLWGMTAFLDKDRQFLHDKLAGTRLISLPKPVKASKAAVAT
ncbi:MAG: RDD family protein [Pseudomonadota bacterium]